MILVNLLPHREAARKRRQQMFNVVLGMAGVAGLALAGRRRVMLWTLSILLAQFSLLGLTFAAVALWQLPLLLALLLLVALGALLACLWPEEAS